MKQIHPYNKDKAAILARLRKIEGQIRGLERMVDENSYCVDILTQLASARSALESLGLLLLQDHIEGCVRDSLKGSDGAASRKIDELIATVNRFIKT
jgi:CsoR family transcriptional regulator, copper-sensing transcriptional repressor